MESLHITDERSQALYRYYQQHGEALATALCKKRR